jgi:hypothetical protein
MSSKIATPRSRRPIRALPVDPTPARDLSPRAASYIRWLQVMSSPTVRHISDTARWAAVYRARETERKNPLFRDPFARRLAGERGEQIANATPFHEKHSWSWVTRTYLFDSIIREQAGQAPRSQALCVPSH